MPLLSEAQLQEVLDTDPYRESREDYVKRMEAEGFKIYYPEPNEVTVDLDSVEARKDFKTKIDRVRYELEINHAGSYPPIEYEVKPSKTEGHYHAIVKMPFEIDKVERIALQAVLGSDPVREMLSIFRVWLGDPYPTLLAMKLKGK
jgi:hypothetical protein